MEVTVSDSAVQDSDADLVCVGVFDGEEIADRFGDAPGAADVKTAFKKLTMVRPAAPARLLAVGLGKREEFTPERARVAAALGVAQAQSYSATAIAWELPAEGAAAEVAAGLVEGTVMGSYRFDRFKSRGPDDERPDELESLTLLSGAEVGGAARAAAVTAEAANRARELQNLPSNHATPSFLAERAREIAAAHDSVEAEIMGRDQFVALGMGGLEAVSKGSAEPAQLIVLRYSGAESPKLGLVGKAVTFDTGGISIKPSGRMHEMKMDMSGGAAVLEAVAAIAELELPLSITAVVPATENMPSSTAVKPGDIIKQLNGKTVEVNNTDAEGRLILADALAFCAEQGAERIVDLATLTGAVVIALGSTYAALISNDDEWAKSVEAAAERTGELAWRLPLHAEYKELTRGKVADLTNASEARKAGTIYAASFLEEFVDGLPWVHLDIAGTAWDVGREYVGKGPTGYGVRLLVELARSLG